MNNNYDIVFRADANPNIGMGHVMRCLSVAERLVEELIVGNRGSK